MKQLKCPVSQFVSRCKNEEFLTYAVYDKEAGEFVDGTESTILEEVEGWALKLNVEEFEKRTKSK